MNLYGNKAAVYPSRILLPLCTLGMMLLLALLLISDQSSQKMTSSFNGVLLTYQKEIIYFIEFLFKKRGKYVNVTISQPVTVTFRPLFNTFFLKIKKSYLFMQQ